MSNDSKFFLGVAVVAVLIIGGIIWYTSTHKSSSTTGGDVASINTTDGHKRGGGDSSPVKIVEFGDFECPFCAQADPAVREAISKNSDSTQFIFRNFPLPQHQNAQAAAQAAEAADKQGKYWEMHDWLYDNQGQWENSTTPETVFANVAADLGLNVGQFKNDYATNAVLQKIKDDFNYGDSLSVNETPTFFVNGKRVVGLQSVDQWQTLIDQAKKK